jgi:hypothetical protein
MEGLSLETFKAIILQGGFALLFLVAAVVCWALWMENKDLRKKCVEETAAAEKATKDQYDKRLEELKTVLTALERNSVTNATMAASNQGQTKTVTDLVNAVTLLSTTMTSALDLLKGYGERIERRLERPYQ